MITQQMLEAAAVAQTIRVALIDEAYVLMSYHPGAEHTFLEGRPIVPIPLMKETAEGSQGLR